MRKLIIISAGLLCFLSIQAQVNPGMKAGVNFATAKALGPWKNEMSPGINAGGLVYFPFSNKFFLQTEILYSLKGYKFTSSGNIYTGTATLNYLNIPVLFGVLISGNLDKTLSVYAGPEIGFLLSGKSKKSDFYRGNSEDNLKDIFNKTDIGIVFGSAFYFSSQIGMEARYSYGFTDLGGIQYFDSLGNPVGKQNEGGNRVLQVGLVFLLKKK